MQCKRLREALAPPSARCVTAASSASSSAAPPSPSAAAAPPVRRADLPKAAAAVHELEAILREADLSGIDLIDAELPFIRQSATAIREQATSLLRSGLAERSQAQIGSALQVFFNLGELRDASNAAARDIAGTVEASVASALDPALFGPAAAARAAGGGGVLDDGGEGGGGGGGGGAAQAAGLPPPSAVASWRESLWSRMDSVVEAFFIAASQLIELHRVLCKKRDPLTHTVFASILEEDDVVTDVTEAARSGGDCARGAIRGGGGGGTVDHAGGEGGHRWECADASLLAGQPMLASLVSALPGDAGDESSLADTATEQRHHGAGETRASGVAHTPLASGEDAVDGDGGVPPVLSSNPRGLFALYAPLARSLRSALEAGCSSSPFVRACLASELPRLLELLLVAAERCEAAPPLGVAARGRGLALRGIAPRVPRHTP